MRVHVSYVRSLGATTDKDLTGPKPSPVEGALQQMEQGLPLIVLLDSGKRWQTTRIERIERGAPGGRSEVVTRRSVYEVRVVKKENR